VHQVSVGGRNEAHHNGLTDDLPVPLGDRADHSRMVSSSNVLPLTDPRRSRLCVSTIYDFREGEAAASVGVRNTIYARPA